jgi:hypothetical protein
VAEKTGASYFWVGTDVQNLRCTYAVGDNRLRLRVRFLLTEQSSVLIHLVSKDGTVIKTLSNRTFVPPGHVQKAYTLEAEELPCPVANCELEVVVEARATYSSREYHSIRRSARLHSL